MGWLNMLFNEVEYNSLRRRLLPDPNRLTDELIQQPSLMQSAAEGAADAIQIRDAAKNGLATITAEAGNRIRSTSEEKLSEAKLLALTLLDAEVINSQEEYEEAKHSAMYWSSLLDSFNDRGSSLRRIADMTTAGYLTPNASYEQAREKLAEGRQRYRPRGTSSS